MQYFKNGCAVVARNLTFLLCRMNVVMFQLMIKMPIAKPDNTCTERCYFAKILRRKKSELAPNVNIKAPETVAKRIYQNTKIPGTCENAAGTTVTAMSARYLQVFFIAKITN
jgi:hypothetical protein